MLANDLRGALRQMKRTPLLTITITLVLSLGIGLVTVMGSGVAAMVARPLPFAPDEARVVALFESQPQLGKTWKAISTPNLRDWQAGNRSFESVAPYATCTLDVGGHDRPERVAVAAVAVDFFRVLGVSPVLGRAFLDGEDAAGRDRVVILSDRFWERRFQRDPRVLGRSIEIDGVAHRIIGVLDEYVEFPEWTEMWTPLVLAPDAPRNVRWLNAVARLRPGVDVTRAQADMDRIASQLEREYPDSNAGWGSHVRSLRETVMPPAAQVGVLSMLGSAVLVLVLVCANVANLLLARATGRRQEMAMRAALGASRRRLFGQVFVESLLYAALGGAGGVLASAWGIDLMISAVPFEIPHWIHMDLDMRVLSFAALVALGAGLVFGVAPAWHLSSSGPVSAQRSEAVSRRPSRSRASQALLVAQFAISLVLLVAAVLMAKSAGQASRRQPGFEADRLLTARASLHGTVYRDATRRANTIDRLLAGMRRVPGVTGVAATSRLPASREGFESAMFETAGAPRDDRYRVHAALAATTSTYSIVLGLPLIRGRFYGADEVDRGERVAVVSESMARRLWPGDPLGQRLRRSGDEAEPWYTVVGVVRDVVPPYQMKGVDAWPDAQAYVPMTTRSSASEEPTFVIRSAGRPESVAPDVRKAMQSAAPDVPIFKMETLRHVLREVAWLPVFWGQMFGVLALVALAIAAVGIYGHTAYTVAARAYEFGIRVALGARPAGVVWLVLVRVFWLAAAGAALGLPLAGALSGSLSSLLEAVSPTDTGVYIGVTAFLLAVLIVAAYLPARRAARTDPSDTLRSCS